jgi:hypothetical protein
MTITGIRNYFFLIRILRPVILNEGSASPRLITYGSDRIRIPPGPFVVIDKKFCQTGSTDPNPQPTGKFCPSPSLPVVIMKVMEECHPLIISYLKI